jgi:hypothetical protein
MKKVSYLSGMVLLMLLVGCGPKEDIITKEVTKVSVLYEPEEEIIFESSETEFVEEVVSEINNSRRTGSWDALGSAYRLILTTTEDKEIDYLLYGETGHVIADDYKVFTGFDFHKEKEKPWWKFW